MFAYLLISLYNVVLLLYYTLPMVNMYVYVLDPPKIYHNSYYRNIKVKKIERGTLNFTTHQENQKPKGFLNGYGNKEKSATKMWEIILNNIRKGLNDTKFIKI